MNDYSFSNPKIREYFEARVGGKDELIPAPIEEYLYINAHPLVKPNFLVEMADIVKRAMVKSKERNLTGPIVDRMKEATMELGMALAPGAENQETAEDATRVLPVLRKIYRLSKALA